MSGKRCSQFFCDAVSEKVFFTQKSHQMAANITREKSSLMKEHKNWSCLNSES